MKINHHLPPFWVSIQTSNATGRRKRGFGVPVFLLWLLILPIVAVALALTAIVIIPALLFAGKRVARASRVVGGAYEVLCATRGTEIEARGANGKDAIIVIK
ncbi:MAG: hypothetical protein AAB425_14230 [Bdellovibrionota bacterium]